MRVLPLVLSLSASALFAQLGAPNAPVPDLQRSWSLGAQSYGPTFTGHFSGIQDGLPIALDLDSDLGLAKQKTTPGFFVDYQGPRFALQVSSGTAEYRGDRVVTQVFTFQGQTYKVGTRVQSHVKLAALDGVWTIKVIKGSDAWLGLDLGVQAWTLDMDATGTPTTGPVQTGSTEIKAPIPQIGLSVGGRGLSNLVEAKAYVHYLGYKQAKYTMVGADLRIFPVQWFGLRAFYEGSTFDVPKGSIKDDLAFNLERKGVGLGAVLRF